MLKKVSNLEDCQLEDCGYKVYDMTFQQPKTIQMVIVGPTGQKLVIATTEPPRGIIKEFVGRQLELWNLHQSGPATKKVG